MSIFKIVKNEPFVMVSKQVIDNKGISCLAKYLLILLTRYGDGFEFSGSSKTLLQDHMKIDDETLDSLFKELKDQNYIE